MGLAFGSHGNITWEHNIHDAVSQLFWKFLTNAYALWEPKHLKGTIWVQHVMLIIMVLFTLHMFWQICILGPTTSIG